MAELNYKLQGPVDELIETIKGFGRQLIVRLPLKIGKDRARKPRFRSDQSRELHKNQAAAGGYHRG